MRKDTKGTRHRLSLIGFELEASEQLSLSAVHDKLKKARRMVEVERDRTPVCNINHYQFPKSFGNHAWLFLFAVRDAAKGPETILGRMPPHGR